MSLDVICGCLKKVDERFEKMQKQEQNPDDDTPMEIEEVEKPPEEEEPSTDDELTVTIVGKWSTW